MIDRKKAFSFDEQADLYERIRPHYPDALFQTLETMAQLKPSSLLLEIGVGTGQATESLARRGYSIVGVEPGMHLATVARKKFASNKKVSIVTSTFEDFDSPKGVFDLIYSATAFHWIAPEAKFAKTHDLLKPGGHLAVIHTNHVSDEQGDVYFHASRKIHETYLPEEAKRMPHRPRVSDLKPPHFDPTLFDLKLFTYLPITVRYSAKEYADLQHTYSPVLLLSPQKRTEYLSKVEDLIMTEFDGYIDKHFAMSLALAKAIER